MGTTYYESAGGIRISKARALRELARHGLTDAESIAAFYADCGERDSYLATRVLEWLGY